MIVSRPGSLAAIVRGIPPSLEGTLCTCRHTRRPGTAHEAAYVLAFGLTKAVGCVGAAAAFAAQHRLPFPLTSSTPPEAP